MLILGEVLVDYTLATQEIPCKLRLGGIIHAARGLWANDTKYSAAVICPTYLQKEITQYLETHGCSEIIFIGEVVGAPNVISFSDPKEIGHQGYEELLRDRKQISLYDNISDKLKGYKEVVIFPGGFDLVCIKALFGLDTRFSLDIAYDIDSVNEIIPFKGQLRAIFLSTSSELFLTFGKKDLTPLLEQIASISAEALIFKENRGGSRVFDFTSDKEVCIPAILSKTVNSVGVGDVYSAVTVSKKSSLHMDWEDSAWLGALSATAYSQTTFPDDFKRDVKRNNDVPLQHHKLIGGATLTWHDRPSYSIYLAAPDFSYVERQALDKLIKSLEYHNFKLRRPIIENGELNENSTDFERRLVYSKDCAMIDECELMIAVPLNKDPGTLVEIGIAIAKGKPVITYDPYCENDNNMVIQGSNIYSSDIDECLNGLFSLVSKLGATK
ncbi:nucleoside 2-deoxyribosyltransferase [Vibrio parahaemolyticus]|uniref:nucleoside 2-deoxyribosyltransferase n=1 Tax=Vibrio parahaemolyticus TaxID=670 RepID=UPI0009B6DD76|nr:nucleoside 2-deoxyribosyltransferase [Vibrio parahaemolyticus]OQK29554.1 putative PfkB family carbohydrate kinase [Vibrio parahaemolyticus]TON24939.1 sugar kinase [Vibrio parahaemolyticus]